MARNFSRFGQLLDMSHQATLTPYNRNNSGPGYSSGGILETSKTYISAVMVAADNLNLQLSVAPSETNRRIMEYAGVSQDQFNTTIDYLTNKQVGQVDKNGFIVLDAADTYVAGEVLADNPLIREPTFSLAFRDGKLGLYEDSPFYGNGARTGLGSDAKREGVSPIDDATMTALDVPKFHIKGGPDIESLDFLVRGMTVKTTQEFLEKFPEVKKALHEPGHDIKGQIMDIRLATPGMIANQDVKLTDLTDLTLHDGFIHKKHDSTIIKGAPDAALEAFHKLSTRRGRGNTPSVKEYVARAIVTSDYMKKKISIHENSRDNEQIAEKAGMSSQTLLDAARMMVGTGIAKLKGRILDISESVVKAARDYDKGISLAPVHYDLYNMREVRTMGDRVKGVSLSLARFVVVEVSPFVAGGCRMVSKPVASALGFGRKAMERMAGLMPSLRKEIAENGLQPVAASLTLQELVALDNKVGLAATMERINGDNRSILHDAYKFGTLNDVIMSHNDDVASTMNKIKDIVPTIQQKVETQINKVKNNKAPGAIEMGA